jgi:class 3 adenylate cyclase/tetratricopeptide (TPR) repeat protein
MRNLVPHLILEQFATGELSGRFQATALFVDISGFSAITDALMQHGQYGAEVLATVMNSIFDPLVRSVYEQGGFVGGFAGDAFTAIFPDSPVHALAAGWTIQQHMGSHADYDTPYGRFSVFAKVGAAAGEVAWGIVTSEGGQRASYYFQGTAIDGCASAEKAAGAGDVMLDASLYELVHNSVTVEAVGDFHQVTALTAPMPAPRPVNLPPQNPELAAHFFPESVTQSGSVGEFRRVVSLFISLPTVRTESQLGIFMGTVFALQERYGGLLNRLDFGDKGANLLLFWGAPVTFENDVQRALQFILDLQTRTAIPINGGITYRIAHAGYVGSTLRGEYTCYGRGVNLAARFMTQAPRGEIWLDENVARRAEGEFDLDYEGEMPFKGFTEPQKVYALFERKETSERLYTTRFVGREAELDKLSSFVEPIFAGRFAGMFVVRGEPGIGKSRLVNDFLAQLQPPIAAQQADFAVFLAQTDEILRRSLNPFSYWLRHYFSVSDAVVESRNKRSFNRALDDLIARTAEDGLAEELDRTRSCLGALLGLHWPDSLYEQLDAKSRHENTLGALVTLLRAESLQQPVIFLWEDIHWSDEDSISFSPRLLRELSGHPVAILATARLEGVELPLDELAVEQLELAGLTRSALATLAESILDGTAAEDLLDLLAERAEGNPFFAEQILRYLGEHELLVERSGRWELKASERTDVPTDVQAVLIARLDRLAQEIRDVVQTAAVLGREFEVRLLSRMLQDDDRLLAKVAEAEHEAVWAALSEMRYIFRHALLRDAAYRMQLHARRQALHALALRSLESLYEAKPGPHYGEMAHHALAAQLAEPAFQYSVLAGDEAMQRYAMPEAVGHYENAGQLFRGGSAGEPDSADIRHLFLQLGRAQELVWDYASAEATYLEMLSLASERGDQALELAALTALCVIYATHTPLFNTPKARERGQDALALAQKLEDRAAEARALWGMMLVEFYSGGDSQKVFAYGEESLSIAREMGLKELMGFVLGNLTYAYFNEGALEEAREANNEAQAIWRELGNLPMLADSYTLKLAIHRVAGEYDAALTIAPEALRLSESIGNLMHEMNTLMIYSESHMIQGRFGQALDKLDVAGAMVEQSGHDMLALGYYAGMTPLCLAAGALDQAEQWADKLSEVIRGNPIPVFQAVFLASVGRAKIARGKIDEGKSLLEEAFEGLDRERLKSPFLAPLYVADGHLQLALGNAKAARRRLHALIRRLKELGSRYNLAESLWLYGKTWLALDNTEEAKKALLEATAVAEKTSERTILWQILATLSDLERMGGNRAEAGELRGQAQKILDYIAEHAGSDELRDSFLAQPAAAQLLAADPPVA